MNFTLIDKIVELKPGKSITAIKNLSLAEEYLQDHFPLFPVMPGVLMLEAMYQAGAWLIRESEDYANSIILLKEARNVKYAKLVEPGQTLKVKMTIQKEEGSLTTLKGVGTVDGESAVSGKIILEKFTLADRVPERTPMDDYARRRLKEIHRLLCQPKAG